MSTRLTSATSWTVLLACSLTIALHWGVARPELRRAPLLLPTTHVLAPALKPAA